jgi:hypothetical protein
MPPGLNDPTIPHMSVFLTLRDPAPDTALDDPDHVLVPNVGVRDLEREPLIACQLKCPAGKHGARTGSRIRA